MFPNPTKMLRPVLRCPGKRYSGKERLGRGFSLIELKEANIDPNYAQSIGIAVRCRPAKIQQVRGKHRSQRRQAKEVHEHDQDLRHKGSSNRGGSCAAQRRDSPHRKEEACGRGSSALADQVHCLGSKKDPRAEKSDDQEAGQKGKVWSFKQIKETLQRAFHWEKIGINPQQILSLVRNTAPLLPRGNTHFTETSLFTRMSLSKKDRFSTETSNVIALFPAIPMNLFVSGTL